MEEDIEIKWFCRFHPTDWWHEVGCPHIEWTKEQLIEVIIEKKKFEEKRVRELYEKKFISD